MALEIGSWVKRNRSGGKWHLVESIITGDAITRCGRRMPEQAAPWAGGTGKLDVSPVMPLTRMIGQPQLCRTCDSA